MLEQTLLKGELRYGCPAADQVLINRFYSVGYSYYFRQAKWALEIVNPDIQDMDDVERSNNFRSDYRVPKRFRADLSDYKGSNYDRGHLVASADQISKEIQNSETFLLTNMAPQHEKLNRQKWRELESEIRKLNQSEKVLETYVITGPIFDFGVSIKMIGEKDNNGVSIPIPSHFFKCVLIEEKSGKLKMWAFELENRKQNKALKEYRVSTNYIEQRTGILLWDKLRGASIQKEKKMTRAMWKS